MSYLGAAGQCLCQDAESPAIAAEASYVFPIHGGRCSGRQSSDGGRLQPKCQDFNGFAGGSRLAHQSTIRTRMWLYFCIINFMDANASGVLLSGRECLKSAGSTQFTHPRNRTSSFVDRGTERQGNCCKTAHRLSDRQDPSAKLL